MCIRDSIRTEYTREVAELIPLLTSLWLAPTVYPATAEGMLRKFQFIGEMLDKMGVPIVDDEIMELARQYFIEIESSDKTADK